MKHHAELQAAENIRAARKTVETALGEIRRWDLSDIRVARLRYQCGVLLDELTEMEHEANAD